MTWRMIGLAWLRISSAYMNHRGTCERLFALIWIQTYWAKEFADTITKEVVATENVLVVCENVNINGESCLPYENK